MTETELEAKLETLKKNVYVANEKAASARATALGVGLLLKDFSAAVESGNAARISKATEKIHSQLKGVH